MKEWWWLSLIVIFIFIGLNIAIFFLRKKPQLSYAVAYSISAFMLLFKVIEYTYYQAIGQHINIPVEFSALSYFILGIVVTFRLKKLEPLAAFVSILAGFVYSAVCWASPATVVAEAQAVGGNFFLVTAIIMHHLLYFGGMLLLLNTRHFSYKGCWVLVLGAGIMVGYAWIIYSFTGYADFYKKPMIIQTTDGTILNHVKEGIGYLNGWQLALFLIAEVILLGGAIAGFYSINNILAKRRQKKGLSEDYYPEKWINTYKFKVEKK